MGYRASYLAVCLRLAFLGLLLVTAGCHRSASEGDTANSDKERPESAVELTEAGACGSLAAYGASESGDVAIRVYMRLLEPPPAPWTSTVELPSSRVEMELITGEDVDTSLCTDVPKGVIETRLEPQSGSVSVGVSDGIATVTFAGVAELESYGLASGGFSAPIGPAPG